VNKFALFLSQNIVFDSLSLFEKVVVLIAQKSQDTKRIVATGPNEEKHFVNFEAKMRVRNLCSLRRKGFGI
jgi:hypothetical protein